MIIEDIERAVSELKLADLDEFRLWFDNVQAARFDEKIERDLKAGKLDADAERAITDLNLGVPEEGRS